MELNDRIRYLRKELLNLTLDQFGEKIGLKKSALSHLENGNANITDQTRRSICREFNVNESWLLTGEGDVFLAKSVNDEITDFVKKLQTDNESFKAKLITILSRMTPDEWDLLEKMIRRLADLDEEVAPVQQDYVAMAETEYIKNTSEHVPPMEPAASNSTAGDGNGETA